MAKDTLPGIEVYLKNTDENSAVVEPPVVIVPGGKVPGASTPGTGTPGASVPDGEVPEVSPPGTGTPGASVPDGEVPEVSPPGTGIPGASVPEIPNNGNKSPTQGGTPGASAPVQDTTGSTGFIFYIINLLTNDQIVVELLPEEVSDTTQGQFDEIVPRGRSNPIYGYSTSGPRTVSFSIQLHDDYCPGGHGSIISYVNRLRALPYPAYNGGSISSPRCLVRIGDMINFTGVCKEVSATWKKPFKNGFYMNAEVSLSFDEVQSVAKSSSQIAEGDFSG